MVVSVGKEPSQAERQVQAKLQGAAAGSGIGALTGGLLGLLVGMSAFEVPEAGILIAVGPIVGALSDAIAGGALGAVAGALVGIRLPEKSAKVYEDMVTRGNVLISVQAEDAARQATAMEIFKENGAEQISDLN